MNDRHAGTVKWFNRIKGYGFIVDAESGDDVFVHYTAIDGSGYRNLFEGESVRFKMIDAGRGPQAQDVRTISLY